MSVPLDWCVIAEPLTRPVLLQTEITQLSSQCKNMQWWSSHPLFSSICIASNMWVSHIWSAASLTHIYSQIAQCCRSECPPWATCTGTQTQTNKSQTPTPSCCYQRSDAAFIHICLLPLLPCSLLNRWNHKLACSPLYANTESAC